MMYAKIVDRQIAAFERRYGVSAAWLGQVYRASRRAYLKFGLFMPLAGHRVAATAEAIAIARIVAVRNEDCGPCLQIAVTQGQLDGVAPKILRAALDGKPERLPVELALVYRFAEAVATAAPDAALLGEELSQRLGETVRVDLAIAIATVRVFPTVKRGLGHAVSCARVDIDFDAPKPLAAASASR